MPGVLWLGFLNFILSGPPHTHTRLHPRPPVPHHRPPPPGPLNGPPDSPSPSSGPLSGPPDSLVSLSPSKLALLSEYRAARQQYLTPLVEDAMRELQPQLLLGGGQGGVSTCLVEPPPPHSLIWQVEELCSAHHCYSHLFEVCEVLATVPTTAPLASSAPLHDISAAEQPAAATAVGPDRMYMHMASLAAEDGALGSDTFANWVFGQLLEAGRYAELLSLPPEFWPGLTIFLEPHPHLLALLLLRGGEWRGAATALVQDAGTDKVARVCGGVSNGSKPTPSLLLPLPPPPLPNHLLPPPFLQVFSSHRRLLCLSKLAAHVAQDYSQASSADAALQLLACQERLGLGGDHAPRTAESLAEAALQVGALAVVVSE